MIAFRINAASHEVTAFRDKEAAIRTGNSGTVVETDLQLAKANLPTKVLVELWNRCNPDRPASKTWDRQKLAEKVFPLLSRMAVNEIEPAPTPEKENEVAKKSTAKKAKVAPKKTAAKTNGAAKRTNAYSGKKLTATAKDKKNHRKPGTGGHAAMEIVLKNPGITYEDYLAKGGRRIDLAWELDPKRAAVRLS